MADSILNKLDFQQVEIQSLLDILKKQVISEQDRMQRLFERNNDQRNQTPSQRLQDLKQKIETLSLKKNEYLAEVSLGAGMTDMEGQEEASPLATTTTTNQPCLKDVFEDMRHLLTEYHEKAKLLSTLEQLPANLELAKLKVGTLRSRGYCPIHHTNLTISIISWNHVGSLKSKISELAHEKRALLLL